VNGAATQIASHQFDADFFQLSQAIQARVQSKIDSMGFRLAAFQHFLVAIGHCREIYRD
jgi:hypothetical protein